MEWESAGSEHIREHSSLTMDEKTASLFQPDTVLPAQYYGNLRRRALLEPEMQLTLAILEDAINCFQENLMAESVKGKKLFNEAEEWILDEDGDWIFSFRNVCELLGFNPSYMRQGLLRWKQERQRRDDKDWEEKRLAG
jgi:PAS domain-containing protein